MGALIATIFTVIAIAISSFAIVNPNINFDTRSKAMVSDDDSGGGTSTPAPVNPALTACINSLGTWVNGKCIPKVTPIPTYAFQPTSPPTTPKPTVTSTPIPTQTPKPPSPTQKPSLPTTSPTTKPSPSGTYCNVKLLNTSGCGGGNCKETQVEQTWTDYKCDTVKICVDADSCKAAVCSAGEYQCDGNISVSCLGGQYTGVKTPCNLGCDTQTGKCKIAPITLPPPPPSKANTCDDSCDVNDPESCGANEFCFKPATGCSYCKIKDAVCTAGIDRLCSGNILKVCNSTGTGWTQENCGTVGCNSVTKTCNPKRCTNPTAENTATICNREGGYNYCNDGTWEGKSCPSGFVCLTGGACTPISTPTPVITVSPSACACVNGTWNGFCGHGSGLPCSITTIKCEDSTCAKDCSDDGGGKTGYCSNNVCICTSALTSTPIITIPIDTITSTLPTNTIDLARERTFCFRDGGTWQDNLCIDPLVIEIPDNSNTIITPTPVPTMVVLPDQSSLDNYSNPGDNQTFADMSNEMASVIYSCQTRGNISGSSLNDCFCESIDCTSSSGKAIADTLFSYSSDWNGLQCVEFVAVMELLNKNSTTSNCSGDGAQTGAEMDTCDEPGYLRCYKEANSRFQVGDIVVWAGGEGHVAICVEVFEDGTRCTIAESNWEGDQQVGFRKISASDSDKGAHSSILRRPSPDNQTCN